MARYRTYTVEFKRQVVEEGAVAGVVGIGGGVISGLCNEPMPALARRRRSRHDHG